VGRCADDARLFLAATQGPDDADIASIPAPLDLGRPLDGDVTGMRLALSPDLGLFAVDDEIADAVADAAARLADAGATVDDVEVVVLPEHEQAWVTIWTVFMAAYYGDRLEQFGDRMDPEVVGLIEAGRQVSAVDYKRVEVIRTDLWRRLAAVLADHEALLCPTMATPPLPAAKADAAELRSAIAERHPSPALTTVLNLVPQCPVVSVPVGAHRRTADAGLPIGMQVVGRRWREDTVLRIARAIELGEPRR
jgi:amidase/aspartyl-tRNA(Asn)/glutamyl-tRNA(Gln) amidotransferase subunit A